EPRINDSGQIIFNAGISSNNSAIYSSTGSTLTLVARRDGEAPGINGGHFRGFTPPTLNNAGQVVFSASFDEPGANIGSGVFAGAPGSLQLIARQGSPAPGTPAGVNFNEFNGYR